MSQDMVHIGSLSRDTQFALEKYSDAHDYGEWLGDHTWIQSHWFAWLVALLKAEEDLPELFPRGKAATIQRMEQLLDEAVRK